MDSFNWVLMGTCLLFSVILSFLTNMELLSIPYTAQLLESLSFGSQMLYIFGIVTFWFWLTSYIMTSFVSRPNGSIAVMECKVGQRYLIKS